MKQKNDVFNKLKKELFSIKRNIPLKKHTTFKIGGPAEYFLLAKNTQEIKKAVKIAKKFKMPIFIIGGGSNLLVSDKGVKGLVIKIQNSKLKIKNSKFGAVVTADAGVELGKVVDFSIRKSLKGLEWAGGLPGTFGGAIRGNAGAFGGEIKDSILQVQALDDKYNLKNLSNKQCRFSYRSSVFKEKNWIVVSASVKLKRGDEKELRKIADSHISYRKEKHPLKYPNAGSIFKNVAVKNLSPKFQKEFKDKVKQDPFEIVPTAWFIIGAGLAGKEIGQAQISDKHSNYIVNLGKAKAEDVLKLANFAKQKVKEKYNVDLEMEVQFIGE